MAQLPFLDREGFICKTDRPWELNEITFILGFMVDFNVEWIYDVEGSGLVGNMAEVEWQGVTGMWWDMSGEGVSHW